MAKKAQPRISPTIKNIQYTGRIPPEAVGLSDICETLERLAPLHLAESWDNVGLLAGARNTKYIKSIVLAIDLTRDVLDEALRTRADLLFLYHPPIFKPIKSLRVDGHDATSLAITANSYGIAIYSPHTALDTVDGGTNDVLANLVGATITGSFANSPGQGTYLKLVAFVPENALEEVADAVFAAGAGHIGMKSKYTSCSFRTPGTGTFFGNDSTNPAVGRRGREHVPEIRFETILPAERAADIVAALRQAHPYEEPAFDLLKLETPPESVGLGRFATLDRPLKLAAFAQRCKAALHVPDAWVVPPPHFQTRSPSVIRTLGIVAGSCGRLPLEAARHKPFDCVLTGELKHHDMLAYQAAGIAVVALGHGNTERPVLKKVAGVLRKQYPDLDITLSRTDRDPFRII